MNCTGTTAGLAFEPQKVFGTTNGIPKDFIENRDTYYYLTKIAFAFYLITTAFTFFTLCLSFFACFSRLGGAISAFINFLGLLFMMAAAAMNTAAYVMAKNAFSDENVRAKLGVKAFAFTWTVVACLLLSFLLLCCSCVRGRTGDDLAVLTGGSRHKVKRESSFERTYDTEKPKGRGFFSVSRRKAEPSAFFAENPQTVVAPAHNNEQV